LPLKITVEIGDPPVASRSPSKDFSAKSTEEPTKDAIEINVDVDWQPSPPRLTFVEGDATLDDLGLGFVRILDELPDEESARVVEALEAGQSVTLRLQARD
jgi:hypothetical protein